MLIGCARLTLCASERTSRSPPQNRMKCFAVFVSLLAAAVRRPGPRARASPFSHARVSRPLSPRRRPSARPRTTRVRAARARRARRADRPGVSRPSPPRARAAGIRVSRPRSAAQEGGARAGRQPVDFAKVAAAAAPAFLAARVRAGGRVRRGRAAADGAALARGHLPAYLAALLGTFVPVVFLITLYIQSESLKAGQDMD